MLQSVPVIHRVASSECPELCISVAAMHATPQGTATEHAEQAFAIALIHDEDTGDETSGASDYDALE